MILVVFIYHAGNADQVKSSAFWDTVFFHGDLCHIQYILPYEYSIH